MTTIRTEIADLIDQMSGFEPPRLDRIECSPEFYDVVLRPLIPDVNATFSPRAVPVVIDDAMKGAQAKAIDADGVCFRMLVRNPFADDEWYVMTPPDSLRVFGGGVEVHE